MVWNLYEQQFKKTTCIKDLFGSAHGDNTTLNPADFIHLLNFCLLG